jgi:hypothetical protein
VDKDQQVALRLDSSIAAFAATEKSPTCDSVIAVMLPLPSNPKLVPSTAATPY